MLVKVQNGQVNSLIRQWTLKLHILMSKDLEQHRKKTDENNAAFDFVRNSYLGSQDTQAHTDL